jgi:hypothetical protein
MADRRWQAGFGMLIAAQAAHSLEEYAFGLFEVFAPARFVAGLASSDLGTGFATVNVGIVALGLCCYLAWVRTGQAAGRLIAWAWAGLELANGIGHLILAAARGGYFPGAGTAPLLIGTSLYLGNTLGRGTRAD